MLCRFEQAIFQSTDGYCIFSDQTNDKAVPEETLNRAVYQSGRHITAVGYHLPATDSIEVDLQGEWRKSKNGLQLSVAAFEEVRPTDTSGITAYLSSGLIKGIGPETAKAIVTRFGSDTFRVLDEEFKKLLQVKEIAKEKLERIKDSYQASETLRELTAHMVLLGVALKRTTMIEKEFGANSFVLATFWICFYDVSYVLLQCCEYYRILEKRTDLMPSIFTKWKF